MALRIFLDRNMPVSISAQLAGQIEYGIVCGALKPGEQLPSVRELSVSEGIAHVTASHVYRALKREGLITVRPGMGTYVAEIGDRGRAGRHLGELQRLVDRMVEQALSRAFTPSEISSMVTARLAGGRRRPVVALVGMFGHATELYARELRNMLGESELSVACYTMEHLRARGSDEPARVCEADLILTLAHKVKEVQSMLPHRHPPLRGLTFVVHRETISRLKALAGEIQLGLISTFAEFLPTMLQGVTAYVGCTKPPICAVLSDVERVNTVLASADAVVYASGSEAIVSHVPRGIPLIEYLHMPEQSAVDALRPLLERLSITSAYTAKVPGPMQTADSGSGKEELA